MVFKKLKCFYKNYQTGLIQVASKSSYQLAKRRHQAAKTFFKIFKLANFQFFFED